MNKPAWTYYSVPLTVVIARNNPPSLCCQSTSSIWNLMLILIHHQQCFVTWRQTNIYLFRLMNRKQSMSQECTSKCGELDMRNQFSSIRVLCYLFIGLILKNFNVCIVPSLNKWTQRCYGYITYFMFTLDYL